MTYTKKLDELANKFESKINKYAQDVDSTSVTLAVRPIVNAILDRSNLQDRLNKILSDAAKRNPDISGDLRIGGQYFVTNAKRVAGKWVVSPNSSLPVSNTVQDPRVTASFNALVTSLKSIILPAIGVELNRLNANIEGNNIVNHQVEVNNVSAGIG